MTDCTTFSVVLAKINMFYSHTELPITSVLSKVSNYALFSVKNGIKHAKSEAVNSSVLDQQEINLIFGVA